MLVDRKIEKVPPGKVGDLPRIGMAEQQSGKQPTPND
jgi:hypothetical protein